MPCRIYKSNLTQVYVLWKPIIHAALKRERFNYLYIFIFFLYPFMSHSLLSMEPWPVDKKKIKALGQYGDATRPKATILPHSFGITWNHILQSLLLPAVFRIQSLASQFSCCLLCAINTSFPRSSSGTRIYSFWSCFQYLTWLPILSHLYHISKPF